MERKGFIGGSDAKRILDGEWHQLWLEKTGRAEPEDLSHQFNVQLGIWTEKFHLNWLKKYHGFDVVPAGERKHGDHPFITASLDAWLYSHDTFIEVKHSHSMMSRDNMLKWYQPQVAHYCNVVGRDSGWLSYIAGNEPPDYFEVTPSREYRDILLNAELAFWWHVTEDVEPEKNTTALKDAEKEATKVMIDQMRVVDMTGNNQWADLADIFIDNKLPAAAFEQAKAGLKKLVEADVRICAGHGVSIKRSKSGSLLISEGL